MKKIVFFTALSLFVNIMNAQFDINYLDKHGYLQISGGTLKASDELRDTSASGLFSKNGYQIGFDFNYIIAYGFGIGGNIENNHLNFNTPVFEEKAGAQEIKVKGGYSSTKYGLNIVENIPIVIDKNNFTIILFGEFNAGFRGFNIPAIDLKYSDLLNKYVEVTYRTRSNTMSYLGYSAGIQLLFVKKIGVSVSYSTLFPGRHSIKYSVRKTDAFGNVEEEENRLNNYLDLSGFQFGVFFLFGKR
jgi:hypothetical protein